MTESAQADGRDGIEGLEVSSGGIDVRVLHRVADGGVPAFEYVVTSNRSESVDVMVTQTLPDAVDPAAIGFPANGEDRWTVRDESWMTYERRLQPGATIRTAWGVRRESHPPLESPEVHVVVAEPTGTGAGSRPTAEAGAAVEREPDATDDPLGVEPLVPDAAATEPDAAPPDGASGPDAASRPSGPAAGTRPTVHDDGPPDPDDASVGQSPAGRDDSLTGSLVRELRAGAVPEAERQALREVLDVDHPGSPDAVVKRIQALQRHHDQLSEALETLEGRVESVHDATPTTTEINQLKRWLATLHDATVGQEEFEELCARVDALAAGELDEEDVVRDLRGALSQLEYDAATDADLADVRETVAALEQTAATAAELDDVREELAQVADRLDDLEAAAATDADLAAVEDSVDDLSATQADLEGSVAALEDVEETVAALEEGSVASDVEALEERLAELATRAASQDAVRDLDARLRQVEQGVLGYETLTRRVEELETETRERLEAHEVALADLDGAAAETGGDVRQRINETRSEVARIETRLESEYPSESDLEATVDGRVRSSVTSYALLGVGILGLAAALPLALLVPPLAVLALATAAVALAAWRVSN